MTVLQTWAPDSLTDLLVRAVKTAITTFVGVVGANVVGWTDLEVLQAGGIAALGAAGTVILNAILSWANTG